MTSDVECTPPSAPRKRAQSSRISRFLGVTSLLEKPNDDEEERVCVQQELLQELQAKHIESPGTPSRGRQSMGWGPTGLSDVQLAEHYANCIRLSNENKITQKNAFSLHLIDHLKEIVQSKDGTTNFQAASCTLDASAKIYAYRVDRVYSEALQIAGELGIPSRAKKNKGKGASRRMEDEEAATATTDDGPKKPAKGRRACTLVRNKKSITLDKIEAAKPIDPLMESIRSSSVEGTAASSFLNHLSFKSDVGGLTLFLGPSSQQKADVERTNGVVGIPSDLLQAVVDNKVKMCSDYYLDHLWGRGGEVEAERRSPDIPSCSQLLSTNEEPLDDPSADDAPSFHDDGAAGDGVDHDPSMLLDSPPNKSIRYEGPDDISQFLSAVPGEYSYFTKNFPSAPAGPEHWRLRHMIKPKPDKAPDKGRKRAEKVVPLLDFEELQPDPACFARTDKKHVLEKAALASWTESKLLLPLNCHSKVPILSTFVLNKQRKASIGKATTPSSSSAIQPKDDDHVYDATDDNFCPDAVNEDSNDTITADTGMDACEDVAPLSDFGGALEDFVGDNLVARPSKIPKLEIPVFKANKRFDMRQMKEAIWETIVPQTENKENVGPNCKDVGEPPLISADDKGVDNFRGMYHALLPRLNPVNRENISVPVAFVALLHLAAERVSSPREGRLSSLGNI
ncbi:unnamed protein product [Ixodes hexagonus]